MKYAEVVAQAPRLMIKKDAEDYCAVPSVLAELEERWGLKPFEKKAGKTIYDRIEIDQAIEYKKRSER